jgi:imidazolonepropionase-like amidohydrolase
MTRVLWICVLFCCVTFGQAGKKAQTHDVLVIKGGTIITVSQKGTIKDGIIIIKNGLIEKVGGADKIKIPDNAKVINCKGKYIMPGIIDTHSHMGVYSWPAVRGNADGNELVDPITPHIRAEDAVNLEDPAFKRAVAGGVTTVHIIPGSGNVIAGLGVVIKLRIGAKSIEQLKFKQAIATMKMAIGENPKGIYGGKGKTPATRMGIFALLRETFEKTKQYQKRWQKYQEKVSKDKKETPPEKNLKYEALAKLLKGEIPVHLHCYRKDGIVNFINLAKQYGINVKALHHALEAYKIADTIAKNNIGVATFVDWWGYKVEAWDATPYALKILSEKGVKVALKSDSADMVQRLYNEAAKAVKYGVAVNEALKMITIHPAWMLGVEKFVGSIEEGKHADIAIFSSHPLDMYTLCEMTIIDGKIVFDRFKNKDFYGGIKDYKSTKSTFAENVLKKSRKKLKAIPEDAKKIAIKAGVIKTMVSPDIKNGVILIKDGYIEEVGKDIRIPKDYVVLNAKDFVVIPGMIDSSTHIGLIEIGAVAQTRDVHEKTDPITPHMLVVDAINPESKVIEVTRVNGVTTVLVCPEEANLFSGTSALINLDGRSVSEMVVKQKVGIHINLGSTSKGVYPDKIQTRMGIVAVLNETLIKAKEYLQKKQSDEPPDYNARYEALIPVLKKQMPVIVRAHRLDDIWTGIRICEKFGLKMILSHATDAYKIADELAKRNIPVILGPVNIQPSVPETFGATYENARILYEAGVKIAIQTGGCHNVRNLPYAAGLAVAYGLPEEEALKAITINPAQIFGVEDKVGCIKKGAIANLVIVDGVPLQPLTHIKGVLIKGKFLKMESHHTRLYKRYTGEF